MMIMMISIIVIVMIVKIVIPNDKTLPCRATIFWAIKAIFRIPWLAANKPQTKSSLQISTLTRALCKTINLII